MRPSSGRIARGSNERESYRHALEALRRDIEEGLKDVAKRRMVKPDLDDIMARAKRPRGHSSART